MSMTISNARPFRLGNVMGATGNLTPAGNYVAGGEVPVGGMAVIPRYFDGRKPDFMIITGIAGYSYVYDKANDKILTFYNDNNNAADGPAIEIPVAAYPAAVLADVISFLAIWSPVV
jgi:hypothetical protein